MREQDDVQWTEVYADDDRAKDDLDHSFDLRPALAVMLALVFGEGLEAFSGPIVRPCCTGR
jgi:bifunctional DNase/RNase